MCLSQSSKKETWKHIQAMLEEAINAPPSHNLDSFFMGKSESLKHDEVDAQIGDLLIGLLLQLAGPGEVLWQLSIYQ